jgi:hypothetical protein
LPLEEFQSELGRLLLEDRIGGGALILAGWIAAKAGPDMGCSAVDYLGSVIHRGLVASPAVELLAWRLQMHKETSATRAKAAQVVKASAAIPSDLSDVVSYVSALGGGLGVWGYRRALEAIRRQEDALRDLRRAARSYGTLNPIIDALELGNADLAVRQIHRLPSGYDSSAFRMAAREINHAIQATRAAAAFGSVPSCRLPLAWINGTPDERCGAGAASVLFPERDQNKILKALGDEVRGTIGTFSRRDERTAQSWLTEAGAALGAPEQEDQTRRRLRLRPAGQPHTSASVPETAVPEQPGLPRCKRCGVMEPERGGLCSGCAEMGD